MGTISAATYPIAGITYMARTPKLLGRVARFLGLTTGLSAVLGMAWFKVAWAPHARFFSSLMGPGILSTIAVAIVLLAEAALPVSLLFGGRMEALQGKLFDETLKLRGAEVHSLSETDKAQLQALVAKQREQRRAALPQVQLPGPLKHVSGIANGAFDFAYRMAVPQPKESFLVRRARDLMTTPLKVLVPPLLPLFAISMDGPAQSAALHRRWLEKKGVVSAEQQGAVMERHKGSYRAFGAVAAGLNYIPVLSWFLNLSNAVGAALWAADVEKKRGGALFTDGRGTAAPR